MKDSFYIIKRILRKVRIQVRRKPESCFPTEKTMNKHNHISCEKPQNVQVFEINALCIINVHHNINSLVHNYFFRRKAYKIKVPFFSFKMLYPIRKRKYQV